MTLSDLASIGSLVSGIAVLVSLIYLSQQTRQNTKHTMALIQQGRAELARGVMEPFVSNPLLAQTYVRLSTGDYSVDDAQISQYVIWFVSIFYNWEDQYFQNRAGLIDEQRQVGLKLSIKAQFQSPEIRAAWKLLRIQFPPETQSFVDGLMNEVRADATTSFSTTMASSWRALAAAERSGTSA